MLNVFISYSRQSQSVVKTLVQDIEALGHKVWFDQELVGGHAWWEQVLAKIRECDIFVFALAPEALDSHACKLEYTYAFDLHKTILPILVADDVSINLLPPALSSIQHIDYRQQNRQSAFALVNALTNLPTPQPLPDPLPKSPEVPISYLGNLKNEIETTTTLSFQEQTALLLKLKEHLGEVKEFDDVINLLKRLRKRDDLFAKVAVEIDTLLISTKVASPNPKSIPITRIPPKKRLTSIKSESSKVASEFDAMMVDSKENSSGPSPNSEAGSRLEIPIDPTETLVSPAAADVEIEKTIGLNRAVKETERILNRVLDHRESWLFEINNKDNIVVYSDTPLRMITIHVKAKLRDNLQESKTKALKALGWKISSNERKKGAAGFAGGALLYATSGLGALALLSGKVRNFFMNYEMTREWSVTNSRRELTTIAEELKLALLKIAPDLKTIIVKKLDLPF